MSADAPPGLRRRVMARIERPAPRTAVFPHFAVAAGALAIVVLAVVMFRPPSQPSPETWRAQAEPVGTRPAEPEPAPAAPPTATTAPAHVAAPTPLRRTLTRAEIRMPRITNVFGARDARVVPAAAPVGDVVFTTDPLATDHEALDQPLPIVVPVLHIAPLQFPSIRVEPLSARRQEDR